MHPSPAGWCAIVFCGDDNTGNSGTSAKTWGIFNYDGNLYINQNNSNGQKAPRLWGHSNGWTVGNSSTTSYALNASSFICDSWVRTSGATGWYSETYGGGWYMIDSTWVRVYNNKSIYGGSGTIRTDGRLEVGGNGDKFLVTSAGAVTAAGNIVSKGEITAYSSSDARLKEQVTPLRSATQMLARLRPVTFRWNALARQLNPEKDTRLNYGLIAQQTRCVMPELVHTVYGEYLSLDYEQLISVLVAANQELTKRVTELEEKLGIIAA